MKQIIAIAGHKNSGKTELIKMINYHLNDYVFNSYENYLSGFKAFQWLHPNKVQLLNFADALKEQIIALTGCTKSQLEDQDFKDSLSPLVRHSVIVGSYPSEDENRYIPFRNTYPVSNTYRKLHEVISDDTKRLFGKQVYVESLFNKYNTDKYLIIGDLRYSKNTPENEEGEIKKRGGIIVKLIRPGLEGDFSHSSESSIKDIKADLEHVNENLEDLFNLAKHLTTLLT